MEPLNRLLELATSSGMLSPINSRAATLRVSIYADDAAIFVNPRRSDLLVVDGILDIFGKASGLVTNRGKCAAYPTRCEGIDLQEVMEGFNCPILSLPCTYLGLPLHLRQLRHVDIQPLIDKMANRLSTWKGKFLNRARRLKLLNSSLSTIPTYFLILFAPKKWVLKRINKIRRGFLWKGSEDASGGHCLVRWKKIQRPKDLGGLGVLNLEFFSRALCLRWIWFQWMDPDRPWIGMDVPNDETDKQLFRASTCVAAGEWELSQIVGVSVASW